MSQSDLIETISRGKIKIILPILILLGLLLFVFTYLGIQKSHTDSLELLRQQGVALVETLTLSADNAIKANSFFDLLIQGKYDDLASFLENHSGLDSSPTELADFAQAYGVDDILIFGDDTSLEVSSARGIIKDNEEIYIAVLSDVRALFEDSVHTNNLRTFTGELPSDIYVYYITKTADNKNVIAIVSDALFYSEAKKNIGIGYLVQRIAREVGIEYIVFQTSDGIVLSSRKIGPLLKIEKDQFLRAALISDSTLSRKYNFNDREILELVKPFSSTEYGDGLFRLGISLDKYHTIVTGFDHQMIALSIVIFAVLVLAILYLGGKEKRLYLDRSFKKMKTLSEIVFDSINSALVAVSVDGVIEMANRQFMTVFDIEQSDLVGRRWNNFPFGDIIPFEEFIASNQKSSEYETSLTLTISKKYLLVNIARLYDHKNRATGAVAVIYDYSQIKELEDTAQRKQRLTELGNLAAGVAHEIRNPLNAISIAAQRLIAEFEPKSNSEAFQFFARQIKSEAGRLNEIVTRFLSLARGKGQSVDKINLSRVVSESFEFIQLDMNRSGIKFKGNIQPDIYLPASEDRIRQMIINLVKNGIEACQDNNGELSISLRSYKDEVILSIIDSGSGIPDENKGNIFKPYFTTRDDGTGLGLSIVHQIVEETGGTIEVLSPATGGTEFKIKFPK